MSHRDRELEAEQKGRESGERDGPWHENPYDHHTIEWIAFEDAKREAKEDQ